MASRRIFESAGIVFDINKVISDNKKHRYDTNNKKQNDDEKLDNIKKQENIVAETPIISVDDDKNSDDEEEEVKVKVEIETKPKKRGRKPASITRKI